MFFIIDLDIAGILGGLGFFAGVVLWVITTIFGGGIADQGVMISMFCASAIFFLGAVFAIIKLFFQKGITLKIISIVEIGLMIYMMMKGYRNPHNNSFFCYSYVPWVSAIYKTLWLSIIINFINSVFSLDDSDTLIKVVGTISIAFFALFLGQLTTTVLLFSKGKNNTREIYNNIAYYRDERIERDANVSTVDNLNKIMEEFKKAVVEAKKDDSGESIANLLLNDASFRVNFLQKNGYDCNEAKLLENHNVKYKIIDKATNKIETFCFDINRNEFVIYDDAEN